MIKNFLSKLPPSWQNNHRAIAKSMIERANDGRHKYNESYNVMVEDISGEANDRTAYDVGEEPQRSNFDQDE